MKKNKSKLFVGLFVTLLFSNAFAGQSGCESLANSKWFGRALVTPVFQTGPKMPVTIFANIGDVTKNKKWSDVYQYYFDGTLNQVLLNGDCWDYVSNGIITEVDFAQLGGNDSFAAKSFVSNNPKVLDIPPNGINWFINGVQYTNQRPAELLRQ